MSKVVVCIVCYAGEFIAGFSFHSLGEASRLKNSELTKQSRFASASGIRERTILEPNYKP
jgi:hypothetical protein